MSVDRNNRAHRPGGLPQGYAGTFAPMRAGHPGRGLPAGKHPRVSRGRIPDADGNRRTATIVGRPTMIGKEPIDG